MSNSHTISKSPRPALARICRNSNDSIRTLATSSTARQDRVRDGEFEVLESGLAGHAFGNGI